MKLRKKGNRVLSQKEQRQVKALLAGLPDPCVNCEATGGTHRPSVLGGLYRCSCDRGKKLAEVDRIMRPEKRSRPPIEARQRLLSGVPDWGKNAAGDNT